MRKYSLRPVLALPGRDALSLLRRLPVLLLLTALLGGLCLAAGQALSKGSESSITAAPVALVDEDNSVTSRFAVRLVAGASLADAMDLSYVSRDEALEGLENGSYCAAIILPEGYADAVMTGQLTSAALLLSDSMEVYTELVAALAKAGEELLETGQLGIFAGEFAVLASDPDSHESYLEQSNLIYIAEAFAKSSIVQVELPYSDTGVSNTIWYGLCWYSCCMLLISLFFGFLRDGCTGSLLRRLTACGAGPVPLTLSRFLTAFLFRLAVTICTIASLRLSGFSENAHLTSCVLLALLCLSASGNALLLCLPGRFNAPFTAALAAAGLFLSGGLVPRMELPQSLTALADYLPTGAAARLFASAFDADCGRAPVCAALAYTAICLAISTAVLQLRVRNGGDEDA